MFNIPVWDCEDLGREALNCQNAFMSGREKLTAMPILPVYRQEMPSSQIDLGTTSINFPDDSSHSSVTVQARIAFTPKDHLEILVPNTTGKPSLQRFFEGINTEGTTLVFDGSGMTVKAMFTSAKEGIDVFHPMRSPVDVIRQKVATQRTLFHLINWPAFAGPEDFILVTGTTPYLEMKGYARVCLKVDGWLITLVEVENNDSLQKELKLKGGYAITHIGTVEREYGSSYTVDEVENLFTMLHAYFSFALGCWAGPQLPIGFDASGNKTFERWGLGLLANGAWNGDASDSSTSSSWL